MEFQIFFKGIIIGISIAAPVGPIGVLCIQRTLTAGSFLGLISGLGAATADAIYGFIAAFGLTFIANILVEQQFWFRLLGGGFLCYLGMKTLLLKPVKQIVSEKKGYSLIGTYASTFFLTLTNPMTILAFAAIFAGLGMVNTSVHYASASLMVLGVFLGSGLWWVILSSFTRIFRGKLGSRQLSWINRISGIVIVTFGIIALISVTM